MIIIKKVTFFMFLFLWISSCMKPETEDLWSISIDHLLNTNGYARDVSISNDIAFIAAGEAGAEIWDLQSSENPSLLNMLSLNDIGSNKEISQIYYSSPNKLLHLLEINERPHLLAIDDSSFSIQQKIGQYGAEDTRDLVIIDSLESFTFLSVIKSDHILKWYTWAYLYEPYTGTYYWGGIDMDQDIAEEIDVNAIPTSIDHYNNTIVLGVGQLGIQLWQYVGLDIEPNYLASINLNGTVKSVSIIDENSIYVARGTNGVTYVPIDGIQIDSTTNLITNDLSIVDFANDLNVDHVSVYNGIAVLSLGSKGIALYDVSDPSSPQEKGIFPIGYVYNAKFWDEKLVVCSREGLQIISINK